MARHRDAHPRRRERRLDAVKRRALSGEHDRAAMRALPGLLALALALAGCLGPAADTPKDDPPVADATDASWAARALDGSHDHADRLAHQNLTTPNFRTVGYDPMISAAYGTTVRGNLCGDVGVTREGRALAVVESRGDVAFSLLDVTVPEEPKWLGEFILRSTRTYDIAVVPDGRHVALVTSATKTPDQPPAAAPLALRADAPTAPGLWFRSACAPGWRAVADATAGPESLVPQPTSLLLIDIGEATNPVVVDRRPLAGFGHGVSSADVDGRLLVAATALLCAPGVGCPTAAQTFHFYEVAPTATGTGLKHVSTMTLPLPKEPSTTAQQVGHNDAWIGKHPATNKTIAWVAAWDDGILTIDLSDLSNPRYLGRWTDHDPAKGMDDSGSWHSVFPLPRLIDGRHFSVVGPEILSRPTDTPTGVVRVLDTTDPAKMFEVGAWTLPHDVVWKERLQWSTHYLTAVNTTGFVSLYHGGVWAFDFSAVTKEAWTNFPTVGVYIPAYESPKPPAVKMRWTPTVEEVHALPDGTLVTFDGNSGLYAFRFDPSVPVASPEAWALAPAKARTT